MSTASFVSGSGYLTMEEILYTSSDGVANYYRSATLVNCNCCVATINCNPPSTDSNPTACIRLRTNRLWQLVRLGAFSFRDGEEHKCGAGEGEYPPWLHVNAQQSRISSKRVLRFAKFKRQAKAG